MRILAAALFVILFATTVWLFLAPRIGPEFRFDLHSERGCQTKRGLILPSFDVWALELSPIPNATPSFTVNIDGERAGEALAAQAEREWPYVHYPHARCTEQTTSESLYCHGSLRGASPGWRSTEFCVAATVGTSVGARLTFADKEGGYLIAQGLLTFVDACYVLILAAVYGFRRRQRGRKESRRLAMGNEQ